MEHPIEIVDDSKTRHEVKQMKQRIIDEVNLLRKPVITAGMETQKEMEEKQIEMNGKKRTKRQISTWREDLKFKFD